MKIVALLTGRGNNTLKNKNILNVLGKPVLYYPAHAARKVEKINAFYCSSDDEKILLAAKQEGYKPIVRPEELGLPNAQHIDVIKHGLSVIENDFGLPDILVVLLANNVTITSEWIDKCVEMMIEDKNLSAVVPVYEDNDHHPLRGKRIDSNGKIQMYEQCESNFISTNRQDLPNVYFLSHNFWVLNVRKFMESGGMKGQLPWVFMGDYIAPFVIEESIDIHKKSDLLLAELWIKNNYCE